MHAGLEMILFLDWTSQSLHALRVSESGVVIDRRQSSDGALAAAGDHESRVSALAGDWLVDSDAIYIAGMATGRGGWRETGYVAAPAGLSALLPHMIPLTLSTGKTAHFLPGLSAAGNLPDVMRGEEIKAFGCACEGRQLVVVPGRHSKWIRMEGERILHFGTFLSGEVLALVRRDSIVSRLIPDGSEVTEHGLKQGVETARARRDSGAGILRMLFSARSRVLNGTLDPADIAGYLEGLAIGCEIIEAWSEFQPAETPVTLIGSLDICDRYAAALAAFGVRAESRDGHEAGARAIAKILRVANIWNPCS